MSCSACQYFIPADDTWLYGECVKYHHEIMADEPGCGELDEHDIWIEESEGDMES